MKRKAAIKYLVIVAFFAVLSVVTIQQFNDSSKRQNYTLESDKDVEITFVSSWGGMDTKAQLLEKVLRDFEKENPNIKVKNKSRGNDDFLFTLKTDFAQGNEPDVFGLWPGSDERSLIKAGKVADLTSILVKDSNWRNSFYEEAWDYVTFNNKIYGLPIEIIYEGLFIKRQVFDQFDIKVPTNYEELKEAIRLLRYYRYDPIAFNCTPEGTFLYQNIVAKLGGKEATEEPFKDGKISDCYIKGMYYMQELYQMGAFAKDAFTMDDKSRNNSFLSGNAAMIVQGSWFIGEGAIKETEKDIELIPFPSFDGSTVDKSSMIYGIGNGNFHMSQKAYLDEEKREAAIKLLKYLTAQKNVDYIINSTGSISNIKGSETSLPEGLKLMGKQMLEASEELIGPPDSFIDRTSWDNILVKKFPQMLEGKIAPEEIFKEME